MSARIYHLRGPPSTGFDRTACGLVREPQPLSLSPARGIDRQLAEIMVPHITSLPHLVTCKACKAVLVDSRLEASSFSTLDTGDPND